MMKTLVINLIFLLLILINPSFSFTITELDSNLILGLFKQESTGLRTINIDPKVVVDTNQKDIINQIKSFFEEQCAIECLKNMLCVQYAFDEAKQNCTMYLRANFKRQTSVSDNQKIKENIKCNLEKCTRAIYCSIGATSDGSCLCDSVVNSGENCTISSSYEISDWSRWQECSASCGEGFSTRTKICSKNSTKVSDNLNWLCDKSLTLTNKFQVEKCKIKNCTIYTEWSSWSSCSKICGGTRSRKRACDIDKTSKFCEEKYLSETQYCSYLEDCSSTIIKLQNTDTNPGNITKRGLLKLWNPLTLKEIKLFSTTNNLDELDNIGKVACLEFGFTKSIYVDPIKVEDLQSSFTRERDYLKFVNEQSINGIKCLGNETGIKECSFTSEATLDTSLYELEVECSFDGYYSIWSAWPPCSVTCGAGARTRTRVCNDPPPSVSETNRGNGADCAGMALHLENCVMPRCKS